MSRSSSPRGGFSEEKIDELTTPEQLAKYPYRDPEKLQEAYDRAGSVAGAAAQFDGVVTQTVRNWLIAHGIYDPEKDGMTSLANDLRRIDPADVGLQPTSEQRDISDRTNRDEQGAIVARVRDELSMSEERSNSTS